MENTDGGSSSRFSLFVGSSSRVFLGLRPLTTALPALDKIAYKP